MLCLRRSGHTNLARIHLKIAVLLGMASLPKAFVSSVVADCAKLNVPLALSIGSGPLLSVLLVVLVLPLPFETHETVHDAALRTLLIILAVAGPQTLSERPPSQGVWLTTVIMISTGMSYKMDGSAPPR